MYKILEKIVLASGSPRRSEMLVSCGIDFIKSVSDVDESILPNEDPKSMVERLALLKAQAVSKDFLQNWVLGADTTVVIADEILGKPADKKEAFRYLKKLQAQTHEVWGGIALVHTTKKLEFIQSHVSKVTMMPLSDEEIIRYIECGEPMDKAGAYAIQGIGATLIEKIEGSYTNVVGLNLSSVIAECKRLGIIS